MKNAILGLIVLISGSSFATSLAPNIRLQGVVTPLIKFNHVAAEKVVSTVIRIDSLGTVTGAKCFERTSTVLGVGRKYYTDCVDVKKLAQLSRYEMRVLNAQVQEAKAGEIQYPNPNGIHCLAIPTQAFRYTADNGNVLLSVGSRPCGLRTYNKSEAAKELQNSLLEYERAYNESLNK